VPRQSGTEPISRGRAGIAVLVVVAFLAAACAWWYYAPQTMPSWIAGALPSSPRLGPPLYKWRDDKGRLHVTDRPPSDRPYETVRYDPDTNVVPGASSKD
jgi:Domain of unknown function (DUF4124)